MGYSYLLTIALSSTRKMFALSDPAASPSPAPLLQAGHLRGQTAGSFPHWLDCQDRGEAPAAGRCATYADMYMHMYAHTQTYRYIYRPAIKINSVKVMQCFTDT